MAGRRKKIVTLNVAATNDLPTLVPAGDAASMAVDFTVTEDMDLGAGPPSSQNLDTNFSDPDSPTLEYSFRGPEAISGNPTQQASNKIAVAKGLVATISGSGADTVFTLTGKSDNLLANEVVVFTVIASDGDNEAADPYLVSVTISADDDAVTTPRGSTLQLSANAAGSNPSTNPAILPSAVDLSAYFADPEGKTLSYALAGGGTVAGVSFVVDSANATLTASGSPSAVGNGAITVTASDGKGGNEAALTISLDVLAEGSLVPKPDATLTRAAVAEGTIINKAATPANVLPFRFADLFIGAGGSTAYKFAVLDENDMLVGTLGTDQQTRYGVEARLSSGGDTLLFPESTAQPPESLKGDVDLKFVIEATQGGRMVTQTVTLTLTAEDDAPIKSAAPDLNFRGISEDTEIAAGTKTSNLKALFTDPENDPLIFRFVGPEAIAGTDAQKASNKIAVAQGVIATIDDDGNIELSGTPAGLVDDTLVTFTVTAHDGNSSSPERKITVTINATDSPTQATDLTKTFPEKTAIAANTTIVLSELFTDEDSELGKPVLVDPLPPTTYGVSFELSNDGLTLTIAGTVGDIGGTATIPIAVKVTPMGGGAEATATISVALTGTNDAPTATPGTDTDLEGSIAGRVGNFDVGVGLPKPLDLSAYFTDPDLNQDLTYSISGGMAVVAGVRFMIDQDSGMLVASGNPTAQGNGAFTVTASDDTASATIAFSLTVGPPKIVPEQEFTFEEGTVLTPLTITLNDLFDDVPDASSNVVLRKTVTANDGDVETFNEAVAANYRIHYSIDGTNFFLPSANTYRENGPTAASTLYGVSALISTTNPATGRHFQSGGLLDGPFKPYSMGTAVLYAFGEVPDVVAGGELFLAVKLEHIRSGTFVGGTKFLGFTLTADEDKPELRDDNPALHIHLSDETGYTLKLNPSDYFFDDHFTYTQGFLAAAGTRLVAENTGGPSPSVQGPRMAANNADSIIALSVEGFAEAHGITDVSINNNTLTVSGGFNDDVAPGTRLTMSLVATETATAARKADEHLIFHIEKAVPSTQFGHSAVGSQGFRNVEAKAVGSTIEVKNTLGDINGNGRDDAIPNAVKTHADFSNLFDSFRSTSGPSHSPLDGKRFHSAGDINGDGIDDAIFNVWEGGYVVYGKTAGITLPTDLADLEAANGFGISGKSGTRLGEDVAIIGDLNGDGFDEIAIGASKTTRDARSHLDEDNKIGLWAWEKERDAALKRIRDGEERPGDRLALIRDEGLEVGATYIIFGKASRTEGIDLDRSLEDLYTDDIIVLYGEGWLQNFGTKIAALGDHDGDGIPDILIESQPTGVVGIRGSDAQYHFFSGADLARHVAAAPTNANKIAATTATADINGTSTTGEFLQGSKVANAIGAIGTGDIAYAGGGDDTLTITSIDFERAYGDSGDDILAFSGSGHGARPVRPRPQQCPTRKHRGYRPHRQRQ